MKVYIKDSRLIIGTKGVPFANYIIDWNVPETELPTSFRFQNMASERYLLSNDYIKITDCETEAGVPYMGYSDFITAVGSFFVRALTAAEGEIDTRVTNLESNETIYQVFEYTGTDQTGTLTIPQEATVYDLYNDGVVDQIMVKASSEGTPLDELVKTSSGQTVTVVSLDQYGNYVLSGIPSVNACLVYFITIQDKYKENVPLSMIVDHIDIDFITQINNIKSDLATLEGNGVVSGMVLSINTDTTKFNISNGFYHKYQEGDKVFYGGLPRTPTYLTTANATYIGVNTSTGGVIQQNIKFTRKQRRSIIPIGTIVHSNRTVINAVNNTPDVAVALASQFNDLLGVFNILNVDGGNIFSANSNNLNINKSEGALLRGGVNFSIDTEDPLVKSLPALVAPSNIRHRLSNGIEYPDTSNVQLYYESSPGIRTILGNNDFVIHRIYIFPSNLIRIQLGATVYNSMAIAKQALYSDKITVEANLKENGLLRALLIVKGNITSLNDLNHAEFFSANMFGDIAFGAAGGTTTLQQAYLNSLIPQISISDLQGALTLKSLRTLITSKILEILNPSDQSVFSVTANGQISGNNLVLSKGPGAGIKIDPTAPDFGWNDLFGQLVPRVGGGPAPVLAEFNGIGIRDYTYSVGDIIDQALFHFPHDLDTTATEIFIHPHWGHNGTNITGNFVIEWYLSYAKGYSQEPFLTPIVLTQTIPCDITSHPRYYHNINELQFANVGGTSGLLDITKLQVDGLLRVGLKIITIPTITGGTPNTPFLFTVDLHYRSTNMPTKTKNFPFYV